MGDKSAFDYLHTRSLYLSKFNRIPNTITESFIDTDKFKNLFDERYGGSCHDHYYKRRMNMPHQVSEYSHYYSFLLKDVLCYINLAHDDVSILFSQTSPWEVEQLHKMLLTCMKPKEMDKPHINIMKAGIHGLEMTRLEIKQTELEVDTHYNDDFKPVDRIIKKRLNLENDKGVVLLHGEPGTGKTTYIKHLIACVNKDVIFMPPNVASDLTSPSLMTLLMDNPDSILVIEDAENIITSRDHKGNSPVSALLNLSDGILSDCLNIQFICSFNTDLSKVDTALLRKGRLIAKYRFGKLEAAKASTLSRKLGFPTTFYEPQVLTNVYHQDELQFEETHKKVIGFN